MNPKLFRAMRQKKKRAVDPNAPPRPNLMTHDVKLRDQQTSLSLMQSEINQLKNAVRNLQSKLDNQTVYLQAVHHKLKNR